MDIRGHTPLTAYTVRKGWGEHSLHGVDIAALHGVDIAA